MCAVRSEYDPYEHPGIGGQTGVQAGELVSVRPGYGRNYLVPVDAVIDKLEDVQARAVELNTLLQGRAQTADEIAAAALFLCSDQSSAITGQSINIDGGAAFF